MSEVFLTLFHNDIFTLDWQLCQVVWSMENFTLTSVYPNKKHKGTASGIRMFLCNLGLTADKSWAGALSSRSLEMVKAVILQLIFHVPSQGGYDELLLLLNRGCCWRLASLLTVAVSYWECLEPDLVAHFCTYSGFYLEQYCSMKLSFTQEIVHPVKERLFSEQ